MVFLWVVDFCSSDNKHHVHSKRTLVRMFVQNIVHVWVSLGRQISAALVIRHNYEDFFPYFLLFSFIIRYTESSTSSYGAIFKLGTRPEKTVFYRPGKFFINTLPNLNGIFSQDKYFFFFFENSVFKKLHNFM